MSRVQKYPLIPAELVKHHKPFTDLTGRKYGRLLVLKFAGKRGGKWFWECLCDCGIKKSLPSGRFIAGEVQSCGCLAREASTTHGESGAMKTPEYRTWLHMRERCLNPNEIGFKHYGGRGIRVCERWDSFQNFLDDMGRKPSKLHSIERKDNNGNYEPSNCVWATGSEQGNNKRNNVRITIGGETLTVAQWARRTGMKVATIETRMSLGWSGDRAVMEPLSKSRWDAVRQQKNLDAILAKKAEASDGANVPPKSAER